MSMPDSYEIEIVCLSAFDPQACGLLTEDGVTGLQTYLARNPEAGRVIPETGGLRTLWWAANGRGGRGGVRAIYYYAGLAVPLFLLAIYADDEEMDLSAQEKKTMRDLVGELRHAGRQPAWMTGARAAVRKRGA